MGRVIRNVSVVTELVEEMYKVDLFVDQRDERPIS